ncbi:MAG: T9SS type A sorting domain-containing protein [Saprospiraceae bacterium]|nr:T9SS type A sorting domain-containing protein [Saprospiraceae bacterium]
MKKLAFIFAMALGSLFGSAQAVWNKKLPASSTAASFSVGYSRTDDHDFLVAASNQFLALNWQGIISGHSDNMPSGLSLSNYLQKRSSPISGKPYFLMGWQKYPNSTYNLAYFKPEASGYQPFLTFGAGEFGNIKARGPAILELNDTSLLVFTQSLVRKIASPRDTLWIEWANPISLGPLSYPNAAILQGGNPVFVTSAGEISAVNTQGLQLWTKTYPAYIFRGIALASDGFVICGADTSGKAALVKLSFNGDLIWEKTFTEDIEFNALTSAMDGNFAVTGKSLDGNIPLMSVSPTGDEIWRKAYQKGIGVTILATPDGGYFLTGGSSQTGFYAIKTNAAGETPEVDKLELFRNRNLNNGGFSLTQLPSSSLFHNYFGANQSFQIPADSATTTLFGHTPWLAGLDGDANLHLSAGLFGDFFKSDYRLGIASNPAEDFNRLWSVTRAQISVVRRDFGENGELDSPPPFDMLTWPAKGNPHFRQNLDFTGVSTNPDSLPAPFIDFNSDGIYNVFDGDYPSIKGDRMLWWAITDQTMHNLSQSQPLGVDILISAFAYDCPQNGGLLQSVFVDYQVINRSGKGYSNAYLGFYTDFELGCDEDDNFGVIPQSNSYYVYNQDAVDGNPGSSCPSGAPTFGAHIPIETITLLNQSLDHAMYYNRGGGGQGDPSSPNQYYNYLQSHWADGIPLTVGGSGYNPGNPTATPINYVFPDNPSDPQGWSMCTANSPQGDRRLLNAHGPFTFAAGDTFNMKMAFTFHPDIPHPCPDVFGLVKPTVLQIQQWHDDGTLDAHLDLGGVLTLAQGQSIVLNATPSNPASSYSWSTGQNTPSITVNQIGEYTVTVTPASGCAYSETVLVKSATGTSSPTLPSWQVQPNPAHDILRIIFEKEEAPVTAILRNAQGQMVASKNNAGNVVEILVANLPAGLYWVELWREREFLGSRKVIIAR